MASELLWPVGLHLIEHGVLVDAMGKPILELLHLRQAYHTLLDLKRIEDTVLVPALKDASLVGVAGELLVGLYESRIPCSPGT